MKEKNAIQLLLAYIRNRLKIILVYGIFVVVYCVIFALYHIPIEAVIYSAALCSVLGIVLVCCDFVGFQKRHKTIRRLIFHKAITLEGLLKPKTLLEQDYQDLLFLLYEKHAKLVLDANKKQQELTGYYTVWTHQIKTPLAAMRLLIQSEDAEYREDLLQELFETEQYVDMALQYLRLESMTSDLLLKPYDLADLVKQSLKVYAKVFIFKNIKLVLKPMNTSVLTDEKWLVFVIKQILSNALKYTQKGQISIYMAPESEKILIIEDSGIGIAKEDIPRVFERGFTGYNGRMDKKSTGIGLFLCKQIVDRLFHKLTITSLEGHGTKVILDFTCEFLEIE